MRLSDIEPAYQAFVRDVIGRFGFDPATFHLELAAADEMFFKGILPGYERPGAAFYRYVESALRTHVVYRQLADHLGGFSGLDRVLDFGSGYGRLTRTLRHRMDAKRIWVSDIYGDAVAWQTTTFGVNGVVSAPDPDDFQATGKFSIVFAASVFSHFPDGLFQRWLARLQNLVRPDGLLAFSVHGVALAPEDVTIGPDGIGYARWSESETLDPGIYGMSYVTEDFVRRAVRETCGAKAAETLRCFPRALFEKQDLYVVGGSGQPLESLKVQATPVGGVNSFGRLDKPWMGWGVESNPGHQIVRADLFVGDVFAGFTAPTADNVATLQFFPGAPNMPVSWLFARVPGDGERLVRVELVSDTGLKAYAYGMDGVGEGRAAPRV
ncbi:MAG: methyltransferase domain-containing protein [Caulobacterales bacterium]|nr:methyltransferase domain-containing protein [Caulobacterales bacterium]